MALYSLFLISIFQLQTSQFKLENSNGIIILNQENFIPAILRHDILAINFVSESENESQLKFDNLASKLSRMHVPIQLAWCDCNSINRQYSNKYKVCQTKNSTIVLLKLAKKYSQLHYQKSEDQILNWMLKYNLSPNLKSVELADYMIQSYEIVVIFFPNNQKRCSLKKLYNQLKENVFLNYFQDIQLTYSYNQSIRRYLNAQIGDIIIFRKFDEPKIYVNYQPKLNTTDQIVDFIDIKSMPVIKSMNLKLLERIFVDQNPCFFLFYSRNSTFQNKNQELLKVFLSLQKQLEDKIYLSVIESYPKNQDHPIKKTIKVLKIEKQLYNEPIAMIVNYRDQILKKYFCDLNDIQNCYEKYVRNQIQPHIVSQPLNFSKIQENIIDIVGLNFNKTVYDNQKDVIVFYYSHLCARSRKQWPIFQQFANKINRNLNFVIGKFNVILNDNLEKLITQYPEVRFYPSNNYNKFIKYQGKMNLKNLFQFVQQLTTHDQIRTKVQEIKKQEL